MAKLTKEIKASLKLDDGEAVLTLRQPTNQELNEFMAERYSYSGKKMRDNSYTARAEFFDLLLTKVENLEDSEGVPITAERKELIPAHWKSNVIILQFETTDIVIKNS